jgi:hypothetical protein
MKWSKPYYGISHCGALQDERRATIREEFGQFTLVRWKRGDGFSPPENHYPTRELAEDAGAKWIDHAITGE